MSTITTLKSLLAALAAQSSVTVTVPDETRFTRQIGPVELTVQLPSGKVTAKDIVEGVTIKEAPVTDSAEQSPITAPAKEAPATITTNAEPATDPDKKAPATVAAKGAPVATPEQKAPAPKSGDDVAAKPKSNDASAKVSSLAKPAEAPTREIEPQEKGYEGIWFDHTGRSAIELSNCDDGLCGKIVWLKNSAHNSVCGVKVIGGGKKVGNVYDNGWIYDVEKRKKFDVELKLINERKLRVLGYAGTKLFSKTMLWNRAPGNLELCNQS